MFVETQHVPYKNFCRLNIPFHQTIQLTIQQASYSLLDMLQCVSVSFKYGSYPKFRAIDVAKHISVWYNVCIPPASRALHFC